MNDIDVARLKELAEKATPGPWEYDGHGNIDAKSRFYMVENCFNEDGKYIAAASPDVVLALIAEKERLKKLSELWKHDYEELAASASGTCKKNERLEKEADWLAEIIGVQEEPCVKHFIDNVDCSSVNGCKECWREAARKTVQAARHE